MKQKKKLTILHIINKQRITSIKMAKNEILELTKINILANLI